MTAVSTEPSVTLQGTFSFYLPASDVGALEACSVLADAVTVKGVNGPATIELMRQRGWNRPVIFDRAGYNPKVPAIAPTPPSYSRSTIDGSPDPRWIPRQCAPAGNRQRGEPVEHFPDEDPRGCVVGLAATLLVDGDEMAVRGRQSDGCMTGTVNEGAEAAVVGS